MAVKIYSLVCARCKATFRACEKGVDERLTGCDDCDFYPHCDALKECRACVEYKRLHNEKV